MKPTIRFHDMSTGNRAAALRLVREIGPVSRADLVRATGFTAPSVSRFVDELMGRGLIREESGVVDSGPGRPPTLLRFDAERQYAIAASIFPDRQAAGLTDLNGRVLVEVNRATGRVSPAEAFQILGGLVDELWCQAPEPDRVKGIGLTVPGLVQSDRARIRYSPPHGWRDVAVTDLLSAHVKLPVLVENWVSARTLAERYFGGANAVADFVYVHASTGIGAAVMSNGQLRRGAAFTSTEFGHLPLTADGPLCRCGKRGCLEAYASLAILPLYARMEGAEPTVVLEAGRRGDPAARAGVERAMQYLAQGLTGLIHLLNPSRIVLDGWPILAGEMALAPLRQRVQERVLEGMGDELALVPTSLAPNPHIGGVALILDAVLNLSL